MARFLGLRGGRLTSVISAISGLCFLCYGYAQGVMGGLLTVPAFLERFPQVNIVSDSSVHSAWVTGLTVGTWNLGCVVSAILAIFISDSLGRRRTLLLGITLWTVGEIIQTSSYSFSQFVVGRAIAGFGNGFTTSTAPAYQAECVKSHRKGTMLMISAGAFVSFGYALSYWSVFAFAYVKNADAAWRVPVALQIAFALPAIAMLFFLPDSPRWLILTGREQEALTVIAALEDANPNDFEVRDEFLQIKDAILVMAQGSTTKLFSNKDRRGFHRAVLAFFVQIFQQGTGINLVLQYLSWILLTRMGYSAWFARLLASCSATAYFFASFITVIGIDRLWGRRSLMMFGASGMSGCMVLITITQYLWTIHAVNAGRIASTVFLSIFSVFFAIGWQGMAWLYQVEIVPLRIRGSAAALSTCGNWALNFIIVFITPIAFINIGYRTWIIFAATNLAIIPLVYFFYPETAFRSLEEVDVIFYLADEAPGNPWLNAVHISLHEPLWFGKKGGSRLLFNYTNSSWHRRIMGSISSSYRSRSRSKDEKRGRTGKSDAIRNSRQNTTAFGGPGILALELPTARMHSESPVDPVLFRRSHYFDRSPTSTVRSTTRSSRTGSKRSTRRGSVTTRGSEFKRSIEHKRGQEHKRSISEPYAGAFENPRKVPSLPTMRQKQNRVKGVRPRRSMPETDVCWRTSTLAPVPLRVSRPPSEHNRPYYSGPGKHASFHHTDRQAERQLPGGGHQRSKTAGSDNSWTSFSYPGRLRLDMNRFEKEHQSSTSNEKNTEKRASQGSSKQPREAGRAY